jgi:hypothetical protein
MICVNKIPDLLDNTAPNTVLVGKKALQNDIEAPPPQLNEQGQPWRTPELNRLSVCPPVYFGKTQENRLLKH